jgi:hypothetical protein
MVWALIPTRASISLIEKFFTSGVITNVRQVCLKEQISLNLFHGKNSCNANHKAISIKLIPRANPPQAP